MVQGDNIAKRTEYWNSLQMQADKRVRDSLALFISDMVFEHPRDEQALLETRNQLYAYFVAAMSCLSATLEHPPFPYKEQLSSLSLEDYLFLICSLHTEFEVSLFLTRLNEPKAEQWLNIVLLGICMMYGRSYEEFKEYWYDKLEWFAENKYRVVINMYDEIKSILHLSVDYLVEPMRWMQLSITIAEAAKSIREQPNWSKLVDDRLAPYAMGTDKNSEIVSSTEKMRQETSLNKTTYNWEWIAGSILEKQDVSVGWIKLNNLAEDYLCGHVKDSAQFLHSDKFSLLTGVNEILDWKQIENLQLSLYSWFFAYSIVLTWGFDDIYSFSFKYKKQLQSLDTRNYLRLFGNIYCMRMIATQLSDSRIVRLFVHSAAVILNNPDLVSWIDYCAIANDGPRFLSELRLRIYQCLAEVIGLPTDDKALEEARHDRIGLSLIYEVVSPPIGSSVTKKYLTLLDDLQIKMIFEDPKFMGCIRKFLELDK